MEYAPVIILLILGATLLVLSTIGENERQKRNKRITDKLEEIEKLVDKMIEKRKKQHD